MAISRLYDFVTGTTIEPDEVDGEFNQIVNAGMDLISPADATLDMNGNLITGLAAGSVSAPGLAFTSDANTGLYRSAADTVDVAVGGVRGLQVSTVASAVNYLDLAPSATGNAVTATAEGTDADISINLVPAGVGTIQESGGDLVPAGLILPYGGAAAPTGWLLCDGTAVSRTTYARLFAVVSTTFGVGDGSTTFNLPDVRDRTIFGVSGTKTLGSAAGSATIAVGNLPSHTHSDGTLAAASDGAHTHGVSVDTTSSGTGAVGVAGSDSAGGDGTVAAAAVSDGAHTHDVTGATGATGSGDDYFPAYLALNYVIKT